MVGLSEVIALIAGVAVHTVWVDHEIEVLAGTMHCVEELESVLMMNIIVTRSMSQLEHNRFD